jgi:hypothetical protein
VMNEKKDSRLNALSLQFITRGTAPFVIAF